MMGTCVVQPERRERQVGIRQTCGEMVQPCLVLSHITGALLFTRPIFHNCTSGPVL